MFSTTYCCITLHMHAYLFNFLLFDSGEDGGVGSLTKKQCFTWARKTHYYTDAQHQGCAGQRHFISIPITLTVTLSSPDIDLTITLIRLLTGSKFNTWSNSYLKDVRRGNKRCNLNTNNNWDFKKRKEWLRREMTNLHFNVICPVENFHGFTFEAKKCEAVPEIETNQNTDGFYVLNKYYNEIIPVTFSLGLSIPTVCLSNSHLKSLSHDTQPLTSLHPGPKQSHQVRRL